MEKQKSAKDLEKKKEKKKNLERQALETRQAEIQVEGGTRGGLSRRGRRQRGR